MVKPSTRSKEDSCLTCRKKGEKNMSRYTGPSWKVSRRLGYSVLDTGKELSKRAYAPGQHGNDRKKKASEYGKQLTEKQKLRETYGVSERQFRRLYLIAKAQDEVTGLAFMRILETRLDNVVYRLGFARTRELQDNSSTMVTFSLMVTKSISHHTYVKLVKSSPLEKNQ